MTHYYNLSRFLLLLLFVIKEFQIPTTNADPLTNHVVDVQIVGVKKC